MCAGKTKTTKGPLAGVRVLDLSRILAGPSLTQILGDLGADVIKIENPQGGDDTRKWGPPFLGNAESQDWSAYYLSVNRNKRSAAIDISHEKGQELVRALVKKADIFIENFKAGGLAKYGLSYDDLKAGNPGLVYCSITGFGQTGPLKNRPGYDAMIQAMGGIMSITGEADGGPIKVGVGISDVMCGMYAGIAILAALHHVRQTGKGQYIDVSLFDSQIAWLINEGMNYLVSGEAPKARGTAHPNIVPYQVFAAADGHFMLAVGNDGQFRRFCEVAGVPELGNDARFATNPLRVKNRDDLVAIIDDLMRERPVSFWVENLEAMNVPCGPINNIAQVFDEPQTDEREMRISMQHEQAEGGGADLIGSPLKLSETPVEYRIFPPTLGEHTLEILQENLDLGDDEIEELKEKGVINV